MPYSSFDSSGDLIDQYICKGIEAVVVLAGEQEYLEVSGRDLKQLYSERDFEVLHLPIPNSGIPNQEKLVLVVKAAHDLAKEGKNIVVHCHVGIGRTGLFAACLARQVFGLSGEAAIAWVRERIPVGPETPQQRNTILNFQPQEG